MAHTDEFRRSFVCRLSRVDRICSKRGQIDAIGPKPDIRRRLAFMRDARGGSGSSRGQDRGPQITLPCRMSLTSSGEQPSHSP